MSTLQKQTLSIDGMGCDHCVRAVQDALGAISGVSVENVEIGSATVQHDGSVSKDALVQAVEDAGFTVE